MPELPEIEVTRRGILPYIEKNTVSRVKIYNPKLRLPISSKIIADLKGQKINSITRVSRYLLFNTNAGTLILHLGMTGYLRILSELSKAGKHDHLDIVFKDKIVLRFNDVRKFGIIIWAGTDPLKHKLLKNIGPDPLTDNFNGKYLFQESRSRKVSIKQFIMDNKNVAGVGNIYANESLFICGIHPLIPAGKLSKKSCDKLVAALKKVLSKAIRNGIKKTDFYPDRKWSGYFSQELRVYQQEGKKCRVCGHTIMRIAIGQRATFYCKKCQKKPGK
jgi:formamidopyrimidine-DNA glycosylase